MNASIGLRTHASSLTAGGAWRLGGTNAQCFSHLAPCAIHARSASISSGVSGLPSGGIRIDFVRRPPRGRADALSSDVAGDDRVQPESSSATRRLGSSSRRPPSLAVGPWQAKQRRAKSGLTSRAKLTGDCGGAGS